MDGGDGNGNNSTTAVSRMLVVGADPKAKRDVIAKLHMLCGQKADAAAAATAGVQPLVFSTKYYTANVDVHVHQVLENEPVAPLAHELQEYEAVVCVVDVAREESFLHVSRFLKQMADEQIEVCLLVGYNSQSEKTSQVAQHIERVQTWCLDNEFEFIELLEDAESAPGSNSNQLEGDFGADEKQGMDRVLEALHCNMWASMVMRSQQLHAIEDNGLRELSNVSVALSMPSPDDEKKAPAVLSSDQKQEAKTEQAKEEANSGDGEGDDDRLQTLLRALEITEAVDKATARSGPSNTSLSTSSNNNQDDDEDDIDMAEFGTLISEVRRVRDNGQDLTDEQRRQRAAEVAMKLWNFLGVDDERDAEDAEQ